jgi:hypothetical protein
MPPLKSHAIKLIVLRILKEIEKHQDKKKDSN